MPQSTEPRFEAGEIPSVGNESAPPATNNVMLSEAEAIRHLPFP